MAKKIQKTNEEKLKLSDYLLNPDKMKIFNDKIISETVLLDKYLNERKFNHVEAYLLLKNFMMNIELRFLNNEEDRKMICMLNNETNTLLTAIKQEVENKGNIIKNKTANKVIKENIEERKPARYIG